ncbi:TerC family protein [Lacibacterium aquatile]|uniref:TerC family protein n=1 Tax=Lacibacterium aquatile TaxID=1168082 RepID=A0ABW5DQJ3_9PROT
MLDLLTNPAVIMSFLTLAALEIVLGIDNLLFVQIVADRVSPEKRDRARRLGLTMALLTRLALLASISFIVKLTTPILTIGEFSLSWRDIILLGGGAFLLVKATLEVHHSMEVEEKDATGKPKKGYLAFGAAIVQIAILDIVFSLDSVITAVGMADELAVMVAAVVAAMIVMILAAVPVGNFVSKHPTVKMLALSFLLLIGMALIAEGLGFHIPKGYLYFAIAFSAGVEFLNLLVRNKQKPRTEDIVSN